MKVLKAPQSGSLAGTTASHNRFGQYERNRRSPVQPTSSVRRSEVRQRFAAASGGFSSLTQAQIQAWNSYADSHPTVDRLGQSVKLTGHMTYVQVNAALLNAGQATVDAPPSDSSVGSITIATATAVQGGALTVTTKLSTDTGYVLIAASRPQPAGRTFVATFRQLAQANAEETDTTLTAAYVAAFGALVAGQKIFFRLTAVSAQGVTGSPTVLPVIITA